MEQQDVLLPVLLKRCGRLIDQHIDHLLKEHSIARSQYRVLYYVNRFGQPTQKDLVEAMEIQAPTLTLIVDALVQKGWLLRIKDSKDKRSNRLQLSPQGHKRFKSVPDPSQKIQKIILNGISKGEAKDLEASTKKIIKQLKEGS